MWNTPSICRKKGNMCICMCTKPSLFQSLYGLCEVPTMGTSWKPPVSVGQEQTVHMYVSVYEAHRAFMMPPLYGGSTNPFKAPRGLHECLSVWGHPCLLRKEDWNVLMYVQSLLCKGPLWISSIWELCKAPAIFIARKT